MIAMAGKPLRNDRHVKRVMTVASEVPFDEQAEKGVIGSVILGAYEDAVELGVTAEHFHDLRARKVWEVCQKLTELQLPINELTVGKEYPDEPLWIINATETATTTDNLHYFWPNLNDACTRRKVFFRYHEGCRLVSNPEISSNELVARLEQDFYAITTHAVSGTNQKLAWQTVMDEMQAAIPNGTPSSGLEVGIPALDRIWRGLKPASMNVIAARPGRGKTALAVQIALNTIMQDQHVCFWSYEMPFSQVAQRLIACRSGEDVGYFMKYGRADATKMAIAADKIIKAPLHVEDHVDTTITQIRSMARRMKKEKDTKLFIIDYVQLVPAAIRDKSREREVAEISRAIKKLAMETGVPVLALAQMNRAVESRAGNPSPQMSDLRESGALEQDADMITFLHFDDPDQEQQGTCQVQAYIKKNRGAPVGKVSLEWCKWNNQFRGLDNLVEEPADKPLF